jgi:hypothetical protein
MSQKGLDLGLRTNPCSLKDFGLPSFSFFNKPCLFLEFLGMVFQSGGASLTICD